MMYLSGTDRRVLRHDISIRCHSLRELCPGLCNMRVLKVLPSIGIVWYLHEANEELKRISSSEVPPYDLTAQAGMWALI